MPGYQAHMIAGAGMAGGIIGGATYMGWISTDPMSTAILVTIATLAALFPDCDTESKGQNFFYAIMAVTDIALIIYEHYKWASILGLFAMLPALGKHRGWTHTWWAMLLVPLPIMALPWVFFRTSWEETLPYYLAAVVGYLSHLILDREF
ncbi:metal-dependent hydrolase [Desulfovibrio subterraneus]|uniref:Membrane protein n=1 Tax=Desulfovibrio subterraneus TaxID=2718620 RepID=A0A7J0BHF9_9BACT|nr:metal-dependent hydrolase [Desulfovibrio subterraneus]WBF67352.1 metal-dependent hydrolase [Desulfovibrio subterraneus]GFM33116.1 membrane protein [Desulfovibrio subterraneus]